MLGLTRITMTMLMQIIHKCPHAYTRERGERERERDMGMVETLVPLTN